MWELLKKPISFIKFSLPLWAIAAVVLALVVVAIIIIAISAKNNAKKTKKPSEIKLQKQDKIVSDFESKNGIIAKHDVPQLPVAVEITTLPNPEIFQPNLLDNEYVVMDKKVKLDKNFKAEKAEKIASTKTVKNKKNKDNTSQPINFNKSQMEQLQSQVDSEDTGELFDTYFDDKHIASNKNDTDTATAGQPVNNTTINESASQSFTPPTFDNDLDGFDIVEVGAPVAENIVEQTENADNDDLFENFDVVQNEVATEQSQTENGNVEQTQAENIFEQTENADNDDLFENFDVVQNEVATEQNEQSIETEFDNIDTENINTVENELQGENVTIENNDSNNSFGQTAALASLFSDAEDQQEIDNALFDDMQSTQTTEVNEIVEEQTATIVEDIAEDIVEPLENEIATEVAEEQALPIEEQTAPIVEDIAEDIIEPLENEVATEIVEEQALPTEEQTAPIVEDIAEDIVEPLENEIASEVAEEQALPIEEQTAPIVEDIAEDIVESLENEVATEIVEEQALPIEVQTATVVEDIAEGVVEPLENNNFEKVIEKEVATEVVKVVQQEQSFVQQPTATQNAQHTVEQPTRLEDKIVSTKALEFNSDTQSFEDFDEENPLEEDDNFDEFDFEENDQPATSSTMPKQSYTNYEQQDAYAHNNFANTASTPYTKNAKGYAPYAQPVQPQYAQQFSQQPNQYTPPVDEQNGINYGYPNFGNIPPQPTALPPNGFAPQYGAPMYPYPQMPAQPYQDYSAARNGGYYAENSHMQTNPNSGYKQGSFKQKQENVFDQLNIAQQELGQNAPPLYGNEYFQNGGFGAAPQGYYGQDANAGYYGYPTNYSEQNYSQYPNSQQGYPYAPIATGQQRPFDPNQAFERQPQYPNQYPQGQQIRPAYAQDGQPIQRQKYGQDQPTDNAFQQPQERQQTALKSKPIQPTAQRPITPQPVNNDTTAQKPVAKVANYKLRQPIINSPSRIQIIPLTNGAIDEKRGRFRIIMDSKNNIRPYKFQLVTKNNQVLFESQSFKVKPRAQQIDAFRKIITTGAFEFNQEPNGAFRFNLLTANQRLCGVGDMYKNMESAEKAALATKKYGLAANYIEDVTNAQQQ